jgi:hypothetical protein
MNLKSIIIFDKTNRKMASTTNSIKVVIINGINSSWSDIIGWKLITDLKLFIKTPSYYQFVFF